MKWPAIVKWLFYGVLLILVAGALVPTPRARRKPNLITAMNVKCLDAALGAYRSDYGNAPSGDVPRVMAALAGHDLHQNVRGIAYIELTAITKTFTGKYLDGNIGKDGQYLDGWLRPIQIEIGQDGWTIRSVGSDGIPDTPDDIAIARNTSTK
jgi:hypothetical protein